MLKLKIKIEETEIDHFTCLEEHIEPCYDLGETDLSVVGNFIHHALAAAGPSDRRSWLPGKWQEPFGSYGYCRMGRALCGMR